MALPEKMGANSAAPRDSIETSRWQIMQWNNLSEPVLEPLTNNSKTGWLATISRRSRFRKLYARFRLGEAFSRVVATLLTNSSNSTTTKHC